MPTPSQAVTVTLAAEHWLRIEQALSIAESQLHSAGNTKHAWRYNHTRQLVRHVTADWDHVAGLEVPHAWEAQP
jgi:hypothetical protein